MKKSTIQYITNAGEQVGQKNAFNKNRKRASQESNKMYQRCIKSSTYSDRQQIGQETDEG